MKFSKFTLRSLKDGGGFGIVGSWKKYQKLIVGGGGGAVIVWGVRKKNF